MKGDAVLVDAIASDNLIGRSGFRNPVSEMPALAKFLKGKPALIDHEMGEVEGGWGRIVETAIVQAVTPDDLDELNQAIVQKEGYWQLHCTIAVAPDHPYLKDFDYESKGELSITFVYSQIRCPGCTCGDAVWSRNCPNDAYSLPYLERFGVSDAFEISLVCVPAVKSAKVLTPP